MKPLRIRVLGALLAGVALLLIFDRPQEPEVVGAIVAPVRARPALAAPQVVVAVPPAPGQVPDLFAATPAAAPQQGRDDAAAGNNGTSDEDGPGPPFGLAGFQVVDGVRSAVLLRDGSVRLARAGAVLDGRYQVLALQREAVRIRDQHTGNDIRVGFEANE